MKFKTRPYKHQLDIFNKSKDLEIFALLMDMGTGKTKVALDTASYQFEKGNIKTIVVLAPNGVHKQWINEAIPEHFASPKYEACYWVSTPKKQERENLAYTTAYRGLRIFAINIEALSSPKCLDFLNKIVDRQTFLIIDESSKIKNIKATRTKTILKLSLKCIYKRILTGTPITQNPLDLYSQFCFLSYNIFKQKNFISFKSRYANLESFQMHNALCTIVGSRFATIICDQRKQEFLTIEKIIKYNSGLTFKQCTDVFYVLRKCYFTVKDFKNLDELTQIISPYSVRILKSECLDLPEKIYKIEKIDMSSIQKKAYKELEAKLFTSISGHEITVINILTLLMRLQQLAGGFFASENKNLTFKQNPKLARMLDIIEDINSKYKIIIWARFKDEIKLIERTLNEIYGLASVTYYGENDNRTKTNNLKVFKIDPNIRFLIGSQQAGGMGLNLIEANYMIYYSNSFSYADRIQSEDRNHRIGQKNKVTYIDLIMKNTVEEKIINCLKQKKSMADLVNNNIINLNKIL